MPDDYDLEELITITLREAYEGTTYPITVNGTPKNVVVPAGVRTGTKIRIIGEGLQNSEINIRGDLFLVIDIDRDDIFTCDHDDLRTEIMIDIITATHGGFADVPTMTTPVKLKIPPGTLSGSVFRVEGRGMPLRKKGIYGNLYVRVYIDPSELLRSL